MPLMFVIRIDSTKQPTLTSLYAYFAQMVFNEQALFVECPNCKNFLKSLYGLPVNLDDAR